MQKCNSVLIDDLQRNKSWLTVSDLFVFAKSFAVKVTWSTIAMASKAEESGVLISSFFIPPGNITLDQYVDLKICCNCYVYDDHLAATCKKNPKSSRCVHSAVRMITHTKNVQLKGRHALTVEGHTVP